MGPFSNYLMTLFPRSPGRVYGVVYMHTRRVSLVSGGSCPYYARVAWGASRGRSGGWGMPHTATTSATATRGFLATDARFRRVRASGRSSMHVRVTSLNRGRPSAFFPDTNSFFQPKPARILGQLLFL